MLTKYGVPFLIWLDEDVLPQAHDYLDAFTDYVTAWRLLLEV